ncbi:KICSTOR complex protein ITFG2-like [Babylonia areolata]|uniref:KICSTOR complex protein ITFG2-like n=1 Tax=Babylonia areolata TaxID=304850 RepID=UPI003FD3842B
MWRNVSFVDSIELQFHGNVMTQTLDLGDVDNDGGNELVVGNIDGDLAVFKGDSSVPLKKASNLGWSTLNHITCVRVGDVLNIGKNVLVCLTAEGCCYIFEIKSVLLEDEVRGEEESHTPSGVGERAMSPVYTQYLPANSRGMLIKDTDGDGLVEMAVTYCDRVVRTFRWHPQGEHEGAASCPFNGSLQLVEKWQLAGQIGAVTLDRTADGSPEMMVSQPGRTYVTLLPQSAVKLNIAPPTPTEGEDGKSPSFVFHPLGYNRVRNKDITTVIVGGIQRGKGCASTYHALASLDGSLVLVEREKILWSLQVDHRLFALDKLDVTGNGQEEVVACSWDGQTYIVNHSREVVRYHFHANVAAFAAGHYHVPGKGNVPSFVYGTFTNELYVYHSIYLPCMDSVNLRTALRKREDTQSLMHDLSVDATKPDMVRNMNHWLLYRWRQSNK